MSVEEPLPVVYRDAHLCAVHKPSGLLVHRTMVSRGETRFAVQLLRDQLGTPVHPVHRLDRGTSGVLLFALDRDVAREVGRQFESGTVTKDYVAIVRGHPPASGTIDHPLVPVRDDYDSPAGRDRGTQPAVTHFRTLATVELPWPVDRYPTSRYALVALQPVSGRRHQLRRHLKHVAHPIIGDATYGKGRHNRRFAQAFGNARMLLACVALRLAHPVTGAPLPLQAAPADDFARVARALGWGEAALR